MNEIETLHIESEFSDAVGSISISNDALGYGQAISGWAEAKAQVLCGRKPSNKKKQKDWYDCVNNQMKMIIEQEKIKAQASVDSERARAEIEAQNRNASNSLNDKPVINKYMLMAGGVIVISLIAVLLLRKNK
jgi:hypothetical protein